MMTMQNRDIEILKEKLKKGTISYFNFSQKEIEDLEELLKKEIVMSQEEIESIKEKIKIEKRKLKEIK